MVKLSFLIICTCLILVFTTSAPAQTGLVAEWAFDEGQGAVAQDSSGGGHHAYLSGASWQAQGAGFALSLDGMDDYGECASLGVTGPVTIEAWIKPTRKANGMSSIVGVDLHSFVLTYYNTEVCDFYVGDGSNSVRGKVQLGEWNHVVTTFDGDRMMEWVNGRQTADKESSYKTYTPPTTFLIGTKGQPELPRFKGLLDRVRVYNRALSAAEAVTHFKAEASEYGYDPAMFDRMVIKPYYYPDRGEMVLDTDYKGLQPFPGGGQIRASLVNSNNPSVVICSQVVQSLPATGTIDVILPCGKLANGTYNIHVELYDGGVLRTSEDITYSYHEDPRPVLSPSTKVAGPLPQEPGATSFGFRMAGGGGFELTVNGVAYPFESRVSWPNGNYNRLTAADAPYTGGEGSWTVSTGSQGAGVYTAVASGYYYSINREIIVRPTHVYVKDTYVNKRSNDLGLLIYNQTPVSADQVTKSLLSGFERWGRQVEMSYPDYGPSTFFADTNTGMGIIPIDDVFVVQGLPYVNWQSAAGVGTEKFALGPAKSYTLEWAVYPTASKEYYDFINAFRTAENRIATVTETPGFITGTPHVPWRREVPEKSFMEKRKLDLGFIHCLSELADDINLHIEGIEFRDFPMEMALLRQQSAATHAAYPELKVGFHVAHSIYCTNNGELFPDSKVITSGGQHSTWGDGSAFGPQRQAEGWRWWIFYPTPGNSFHTALMQSVDMMMDDLGFDGAFMDGMNAGYGGHWSYDTNVRWDGHSAEINPATKTITRKMNSVILLSQPSLIQFARRIRDKGGFVVANNNVYTRSITNEKYIIFDNECASGPDLHLAPSVTALNGSGSSQKDYYLDMLDKLSWGELYVSYGDGNLAYASLSSREFPMTFKEIRSGMVKGTSRLVTMNSGVYGWPDNRDLHMVYKFDDRGAPVPHAFLTTADSTSVRTQLDFVKNESAVLECIPITLLTSTPVNVRVDQYDENGIRILLNGQGRVVLQVRDGSFQIKANSAYRVNDGVERSTAADANGTLSIPLDLAGSMELVVAIYGASAGTEGFFATQGTGSGADQARIYDSSGNVVKTISRWGWAMTFDTDGSLFLGEDARQSDGKYITRRYQYLGNSQWAEGVEYTRTVAKARALVVDSASGALYVGLYEGTTGHSDICKVTGPGATPVWLAQADPGHQTQDLELGPGGNVWIGLPSGYRRYPLTGGYWGDQDLVISSNGLAGGMAFADSDSDGALELYASANGVPNSIGYYDPDTGALLGTFITDPTLSDNFCMAIGPDMNGNGSRDIFVVNGYYGGFRYYDGVTGAKLGETLGLYNGGSLASVYIAAFVAPIQSGSLAGLIELQDFIGNVASIAIKVELLQGGVVKHTRWVTLTPNPGTNTGVYTLTQIIPPGVYDARFSSHGWLSLTRTGVIVPNGAQGIVPNVSLRNGDTDGDDAVTPTDVNTVLKNVE